MRIEIPRADLEAYAERRRIKLRDFVIGDPLAPGAVPAGTDPLLAMAEQLIEENARLRIQIAELLARQRFESTPRG